MLVMRRVGEAILALLTVAAAVFFLLHLDPVNPVAAMLGPRFATPANIARLSRELGLDQPVWLQFFAWLKALVVEGLLGQLLAQALPPTLALMALGGAFGLVGAVGAAVVQVRFRNTWLDRAIALVTYALNALPVFWTANALLFLFAIVFLWLPASGTLAYNQSGFWQWAVHMILPVATLALAMLGTWARYLRVALAEAMTADYIRTARAVGAGEWRLVRRHALRNALLSLVTMIGLSMPTMMTAIIVIEAVYSMSGLGTAFLGALLGLSFGSATSAALVLAILTVAGNVLADVAYMVLDPRIRYV